MSSLTGTPPPGSEGPSSDRLESWKEIAAYLKRGVRTVQRWERQEGLPVHRHVHEERSSVFAYRSELDAWRLKGHSHQADMEVPRFLLQRRVLLGGAAVIMTILFVGLGIKLWRSQGSNTSWWSGDGTFQDAFGKNSISNAGGVTFVAGKVGQAFHFDGSPKSYLTLPDSESFVPASHQVTIAAWVKPDFSVSNRVDTIFSKRSGCGNDRSYQLSVTKGGLVQHGYAMGSIVWSVSVAFDDALAAGVFPNDGQFHFVVGTYDGKAMTVYLDGKRVASKAHAGPIPVTADAAFVGLQSACGDLTAADIDELQFYDRALSGDEIKSLMNAPRPLIVANQLN